MTSLTREQQEIINRLIQLNACELSKDNYKLKNEFRIGKIDIASNQNGFLEVFDAYNNYKDLLVEPRDLGGALRGDIVVAKRLRGGGSRPKAKVICVLARANNSLLVYTKKIKNQIVGIGLKNGFITTIKASQKSLKQLPMNTILKLNATTCDIEEVIGNLHDPLSDEKIVMHLYNIDEHFSPEAQSESHAFGDVVDKSMYPQRVDLTHLDFCSIDPIDAKDFDDAIYFDVSTCTLYVAIADVSEYVYAFGATDKEAKKRGFSIYFPHKSIPMLPRILSENICSLKPNEDRLAFCFKMRLDGTSLEIIDEKLLEVVIHSKRRFTYEEVDLFLEGNFEAKKDGDERVLQWLLPLNELIKKIRQKRLKDGFEFQGGDLRLNLDENGLIEDVRFESQTPSHSLIEDCMLLANKSAAYRLINELAIFRNHESISLEKVQDLLINLELIGIKEPFINDIPKLFRLIQAKANEIDMDKDVDKLLIRSQKKANYESTCRGHFGLGFEHYTHFTSPIRRYSDLVLHRILKATITKNNKLKSYLQSNLEEICEQINENEKRTDRVAWEFIDRKFARWAYEKVGEIFSAVVVENERNTMAKLENGARVFLNSSDVNLLERVNVIIIESDIASAKIYAKVVKNV